MAIIGKSKEQSLFQKITEEGSKYREIKYADLGYTSIWNGEPIMHGYIPEKPGQMLGSDATSLLRTEGIPPVNQKRLNATVKSDVLVPITARIDDTERIQRLLTKVPGIKWQAHNAELLAIQSKLDQKHGTYGNYQNSGEKGVWDILKETGKNLVNGLIDAGKLNLETIAQVAVAGTGEHFSAFRDRAYLRSGLQGLDAASMVLGGSSRVNGDISLFGEPVLAYRQLPDEAPSGEGGPIEWARKPKLYGSTVDEFKTISSSGSLDKISKKLGNPYSSKTGYLKDVQSRYWAEYSNIYERFEEEPDVALPEQRSIPGADGVHLEGTQVISYTVSESKSIVSVQSPRNTRKLGENEYSAGDNPYLEYSETQDKEKIFTDTLRTKPEEYIYLESGSVLEDARKPKDPRKPSGSLVTSRDRDGYSIRWNTKNEYSDDTQYLAGDSGSIRVSPGYTGSLTFNEKLEEIGPWKPSYAHKLKADYSLPKQDISASDGGYHNTQEQLEPGRDVAETANTRVDNGRISMIPFYIRALSPSLRDNCYLFFEANLDSYSDNYDASWDSVQYIGRADKFWTYNGFDRNISFSFKMVAHSKSHLKPIYNRLNGLLSMTAPTYDENQTFMRGTLAEITIGDLLHEQLGFIKNVGLKWETDYMWETDRKTTIMVPHVLDVSVNFVPIHRFIPHTEKRYFELVGNSTKGEKTFTVNYKRLYKNT